MKMRGRKTRYYWAPRYIPWGGRLRRYGNSRSSVLRYGLRFWRMYPGLAKIRRKLPQVNEILKG